MVLRQNATRDDVDDAVLRCGWQLTNVLPASAEQPRQLIYATRDGRTVYLIDDVRLGVRYLAMTGEGAAELLRSVEGLSILRGEPLTAAQLEGPVDLLALRRGVAVPALWLESLGFWAIEYVLTRLGRRCGEEVLVVGSKTRA